ncbi:MAG: hypothetical protein IPH82_21770 [Chloroflexi bacterium]|nr:hypothetical protein [Chloroflexota bacterium]
MKWASKITIDRGTVEGVTQFTLTYDEGVQEIYAEQYSSRTGVGNQAPNVIYHESGNGDRIPVQVTDQNKEIYLETAVLGETANEVIAKVTALKLAIRESERANSGGRAVEVAITPDGSAYTTYYKILHGYVDDSHAYYQDGDASGQQIAKDIVIALTCEPFGCGDTFTLANALVSSPHMIVDTDADGLADGLVLNGTPATVDIWTANYLTGGKSQRIITNAAGGEGISTANVTASTSSTAVAYAWVSHSSGDAVTVRLTDGSGNIIQTKDLLHLDSTGVSDKSTKGPGGALWHRVVVTGSNTTAANFRLDVVRRSAIATQTTNFLVDNLYMAVGATTAPPAFSSAKTLTNNGVNYLDFWGIPGDVPALVRYALSGITNKSLVFGKKTDGTQLATKVRYIIEDTYFANGSTWATTSNYTRASARRF